MIGTIGMIKVIIFARALACQGLALTCSSHLCHLGPLDVGTLGGWNVRGLPYFHNSSLLTNFLALFNSDTCQPDLTILTLPI